MSCGGLTLMSFITFLQIRQNCSVCLLHGKQRPSNCAPSGCKWERMVHAILQYHYYYYYY